jgi:hypothetical protein
MRAPAIAALMLLCFVLFACDEKDPRSEDGSGTPAPIALTITTSSLPSAQAGSPFSAAIDASGGSLAGYSWSVVGSALPAGLGITPSGTPSATLSGVPTVYGVFTFQLQVVDSLGNQATDSFTLTIIPPPAPPAPPNPTPTPPPPHATFYGETATGILLFVVEVSGTMAGSAIANLRAELTGCISALTPSDTFDVIVYNDNIQGGYTALWGVQLPATQGNRTTAIAWVNGSATNPAGASDQAAYDALEYSLSYPNLDCHFFYTYTEPSDDGHILANYPGWASQVPNYFTQVVIAGSAAATQWGQDLAALSGGTFVP